MGVKVHLSSNLCGVTGGVKEMEAEGSTGGELINALDEMYPGLGALLRTSTAMVINGLLIAYPEYERIPAGADVHFIPHVSGGSTCVCQFSM